jgi:hypothetical protein
MQGLSMRWNLVFGLSMLVAASTASADSPFTHRDGSDEGDTILPITSYPLGESQVVAHAMLRSLQYHWIQEDMCERFGCLIVQNDTRLFTVAEFRIQSHLRDGTQRWSANLLDHPMLPTDTVTRVKTASIDCDRPVQFVLKHRKTKEKLVMEGTTNLCPTPHADNLIRINIKLPEVTVDEKQPQ